MVAISPILQVRAILARYARQERRRRLLQSALAAVVVLGLGPVIGLGLDRLFHLAESLRAGLLGLWAVAIVATCVLGVLFTWLGPGEEALALQLERRSGLEFQNSLISAVQLSRPAGGAPAGVSGSLVEALGEQARDLLRNVDLGAMSEHGWRRRLGIAALLTGSVGLAALGLGWERYQARFAGLGQQQDPAATRFEVTPGTTRVLRGSRLEIRARVAEDGPPDRLVLVRHTEAGPPEEFVMHRSREGSDLFFPSVTSGFRYRVRAGLLESPLYRIEVVSPPEIRQMRLTYRRPAYTRLPIQVQSEPPYDIHALVGTRVDVELTATKPLRRAYLDLGPSTVELPARADGIFAGTLVVSGPGEYAIHLIDQDGFENPSPPRYGLHASEDQVPQIVILEPGSDLSLSAHEITTIPLTVYAEDDYGIEDLTLKARFVQRADFHYDETEDSVPIPITESGSTKVQIDHVWDLTRKIFQPGDSVTYWIEARDQCPDPDPAKPRRSRSRSYRIEVPLAAALTAEVSTEQADQIENLEDLVHRQKQVEKRLGKVLKEVHRSRKVTYKEQKELEDLTHKQDEIRRKSEDLANRMKNTLDMIRKHDLVDPGSLEKLSEIQRLFSEVADSRMKELMNQMRDLMQNMELDPEKLQQLANQFDKEKYSKELDRILEGLKRLKQRQEVERLKKDVEDLANQQEKLRAATAERAGNEDRTSDLAQSQEELEKRAQQLIKDIEARSRELESSYPEAAERLKKLETEARQSPMIDEMQQASRSLSADRGSEAYEHQSEAMAQLERMRQELTKIQGGMQQKQIELDMMAILNLLDLGLSISRTQEDVLTAAESRARGVDDPRQASLALAGDQYGAARGGLKFERRFSDAFPDDVMFKSTFLDHISQMVEEMEEAKDNFEQSRIYSGKQLAEQILGRMNVIVLKLTELLDHMNNQQGQSGMQGFFDQMERMIQRQRQVNQQVKRLQHSAQDMEFLRQMMMQQALEQQMIRQTLEEMAGKYEQARELLGDLDQLAGEMKDVEEALSRFDASAQTRDKQERILSRMIDYSKSMNQQGESRKREARKAGEFLPRQAPEVSTDRDEARRLLLENISRGSFPPGFSSVVERYFSTFDR